MQLLRSARAHQIVKTKKRVSPKTSEAKTVTSKGTFFLYYCPVGRSPCTVRKSGTAVRKGRRIKYATEEKKNDSTIHTRRITGKTSVGSNKKSYAEKATIVKHQTGLGQETEGVQSSPSPKGLIQVRLNDF